MEDWFVLNLGDAMLADAERERIAGLLGAAFERAGSPAAMAAFHRHETGRHLHCELKIYLSPGFAHAALQLGAASCARPRPQELAVFVGNEDSRALFFP